jgi:hypothetical protein
VVRINLLVADGLERLGLSVQRVLWRTVDGDGCHGLAKLIVDGGVIYRGADRVLGI